MKELIQTAVSLLLVIFMFALLILSCSTKKHIPNYPDNIEELRFYMNKPLWSEPDTVNNIYYIDENGNIYINDKN